MPVSPNSPGVRRRSVHAVIAPVMVGVLVVGAAVAVSGFMRSHLTLHQLVELLHRLQGHLWAIPSYVAIYVVATGLFAPAWLLHVAAGVTWGFKLGAIVNVFVVNLGASAQFGLARALGKHRVDVWVHQKHWDVLEERLARGGFQAILAIRLLPLPTMAVNLGAGVSTIRYRDFALGTLVGTLPVTLIYTYFAAALVQGVTDVRRQILVELAIAGAVLLALAFGPKLVHRLRERSRRTEG